MAYLLGGLLIAVSVAIVMVAFLVVDGVRLTWKRWRHEQTSRPITLTVAARTDLGESIFAVCLAKKSRGRLPRFTPGQYVVLLIPQEVGGAPLRRAYSLAAWERNPHCYHLAIKRQGVGSEWLYDHLRPEVAIQILSPRGDFVLKRGRCLALVAGGIGITPMRAMLHRLAQWPVPAGFDVTLFYAARNEQSLIYHDEFCDLQKRVSWFRYFPILSRPDPRWQEAQGRLDACFIFDRLQAPRLTDFYFCAGLDMMRDLMEGLARLGVTGSRMHWESFGADSVNEDQTRYLVKFGDHQLLFQGQASLLHAFEELGMEIDAECRAGHCGTCRLFVASGSVRWMIPPGISLRPREILACCCVPDTDLCLDVSGGNVR